MNEKNKNKNDNASKQKDDENESKRGIYNKFKPIMDLTKEIEPNKKFFADEDILFTSNPKYIKNDILLFKNEVLKDIKLFQSQIFEKTKTDEKYMTDKIEKFTIQIQKFHEKIIELSNLINTDKTIREKVDSFIEFKNKAQEILMTNGIRIDNIDKDFHDNINRIDNVLRDTVLYPGMFGGISKFKSFHDFMNYVASELSKGVTFREKNNIDLNNYKTKLENLINDFSSKISNSTKASNSYSDTCVKKLENKINSNFDLYNEKLFNIKLENVSYAEEMRRTTEDLMKQINNLIIIKNELFNKFEDQINFIKKDNSRVIKCFTGYKEQFYEMRKKFIYLSDFLRDVRFQKNIGEELTRRDFYKASKNFNYSNKNKVLEENNNNKRAKRGSATYLIDINKLLIKDADYENNIEFNTNSSDKKNDKSLKEKEDETIYGKFLKEYKRTESQALDFDQKNKLGIINKNNNNYDIKEKEINENISEEKGNFRHKKNKKHHHHHHHYHHHNDEKNNEKNDYNLIKYSKEGDFIQRRKNRLSTISHTNINKSNIKFSKLFDLTNNEADFEDKKGNQNNKKIFKRLVTQQLDNIDMIKKIDKLNKLFNNKISNSRNISSYSDSLSKSSNSSSCSSCTSFSKSSRQNSKQEKTKNKKYKKNNTIKEEDEKYNNKIEKKQTKNENIIEIKDSINSKEDKETQSENKSAKRGNDKGTKKLCFSKKNKTFYNSNKPIINQKEESINKDNYLNLIITNYKDKDNYNNNQNNLQINSNSYKKNKQTNFFTSNSLQKITISVEGSNKLIINPNKVENNKAQKNIVKNVQTIFNENIQNKTYNGFPKILTNNGEKVIFTSHPVFHSKKFVNYISPNVVALNHSIQTLFGNKLKKNKYQRPRKNIMNNNNSESSLNKKPYSNKPMIKEYENDLNNKNIFITNERLNTEKERISSLNDVGNKKESFYRGNNVSIKDLKVKNDIYNKYIKK